MLFCLSKKEEIFIKIIRCYNGEPKSVEALINADLQNEAIVTEAGERWSGVTLQPTYIAWEMWIQFIHIETEEEVFFIYLANKSTSAASAIMLKGVEWDANRILSTSTEIVSEIFSDVSFRERRSILMDMGKVAYRALYELNQKVALKDDCMNVSLMITVDIYQPLEVEWIEDIMNERDRL